MKSKALRIIFMGTPDFSVGVLDKLVQNAYNVVCTVTAVDKPAGRGKKMHSSAVKRYSIANNIPILQPKNLKAISFQEELDSYEADLQIVVAFRMLPKEVWNSPKIGTFNLHASLLPAYRGAAPINWAIINGEKETGVTTFFIDEKIDTGEILLQEKTKIGLEDTAGSLHDRLMDIGSDLVIQTVDLIASGRYKTEKQPVIAPSKAPKLYKNNCSINWNDSLRGIYNKIRGLSPYPAAWSSFISNGETYTIKLYYTQPEYVKHDESIGKIIATKQSLKIAVSDGFLLLQEVQLSGKRKMDVKSLLNGFQFSDDAHLLW